MDIKEKVNDCSSTEIPANSHESYMFRYNSIGGDNHVRDWKIGINDENDSKEDY